MGRLRAEIALAPRAQIVLTQEMRLALGVLQATANELRAILHEAWCSNPFLELDVPSDADLSAVPQDAGGLNERHGMTDDARGTEGDGASDWDEGAGADLATVATAARGWEDSAWTERIPDERETWQERMLTQFRLAEREPLRARIAEYIFGCLDAGGYLRVPLAELAAAIGAAAGQVESVRQAILALDPPGLAARDLRECLGAQLARAGGRESLAARIVARDLELLARRRFEEIAARERTSVEAVRRAAREIRALQPHPAAALERHGAEPVVPDIVVEQVGAEYEVLINDRHLPGLRVLPPGSELLGAGDAETRAFASEHFARARWLAGSLEARRRTLIALTRRLLEEQRGFFDEGVSGLRPLGYRRMAALLGLHESTVARAVRGKVVQTPRGVFPLRFFFTHGLSADPGDVWTPAAVARRIRELIAAESPAARLSDEALARRLRGEGVRIARRTVAKYRDRMGISRALYRGRF